MFCPISWTLMHKQTGTWFFCSLSSSVLTLSDWLKFACESAVLPAKSCLSFSGHSVPKDLPLGSLSPCTLTLSHNCAALLNKHFSLWLLHIVLSQVVKLHYHSKMWGQYFLFFRRNSKYALNWSEVTVNTFVMLQKIAISNKCCSLEFSNHG